MMLQNDTSRLTRRTMLLSSMALLAGCVSRPVALDPASMANIKRVGLPTTGFPTSPNVVVINGIGQSLGLIGQVTTAVVRGNRSDAVLALMAAKNFDPHAYFDAQVVDRLQKRGLTVVPQPADGRRHAFLQTYASADQDDAALDVYVSNYGFFALSDSDEQPYRPAVSVNMRLVSASDRSILMQDGLANYGIDTPVGAAAPPSFTTFSQVTDDPDRAVASLSQALSYAADAIARRLA